MIFNNMESKKGMESINRVDGALTQSMQSKGKRNMESKVKGLLFTIILQFGFAATINIPADYSTIQAGIDASTNGDTVLVQPGTYVENINFNGKNIAVIGADRETTIIDGNQNGSVVTFLTGETSAAVLSGFTIRNGYSTGSGGGIYCGYIPGSGFQESTPTLNNLVIKNNTATQHGGGIACDVSNPNLMDISIIDNIAEGSGGGIYCRDANTIVTNVLISGNIAYSGGGIRCENSDPVLTNVTITNNTGSNDGGIVCRYDSDPVLINTIVWNNLPNNLYFISDQPENSITISYADIEYGESGIVTNNNGTVNWLSCNIDLYPEFVDSANGDYHLSDNSPCISRGADSVQIAGTWYYAPTTDIDGNSRPMPVGTSPDMGAYENQTAYQDLVLHLKAENNFEDESPYGNHGTATNVTFVDAPWGGKAFSFNGDGYIEIPDLDNSLDFTGDFTIEMLIKPVSNNITVFLSKCLLTGDPASRNLSLQFNGDHSKYAFGTGVWTTEFSEIVNPGTWQQVAFIMKGDSLGIANNANFYGYNDAQGAQSQMTANLNDDPLYIGVGKSTHPDIMDTTHFRGQLDNIRIYKRALDPSELQPMPAFPDTTYITGGTITQDSTWTKAQSPYVISGDVIVDNGATLTIEPGVKMYFQSAYSLTISSGFLKATGTSADSIYFYGSNEFPNCVNNLTISNSSSNGSNELVYCRLINFFHITYYSDQEKNTIQYNYFSPPALNFFIDDTIKYNTFKGEYGRSSVDISTENAVFRYNNILCDIHMHSTGIVAGLDAMKNYWGPTATAEMNLGNNPKKNIDNIRSV